MPVTRIDMHVHTRGSDGVGSPEEIARCAINADLDGLCLTDHHTTTNVENLKVAHVCREEGLLVFHACEYSTEQGHLLIYGVNVADLQLGMYPEMQDVVDATNELGGVCIPAHPFVSRYSRYLAHGVYKLRGIEHLEVINGQQTWQDPAANLRAQRAALDLGISGVGGSDAHVPSHIGIGSTVFQGQIETEAHLIKALGSSGTFAPYLDTALLLDLMAGRASTYGSQRSRR